MSAKLTRSVLTLPPLPAVPTAWEMAEARSVADRGSAAGGGMTMGLAASFCQGPPKDLRFSSGRVWSMKARVALLAVLRG